MWDRAPENRTGKARLSRFAVASHYVHDLQSFIGHCRRVRTTCNLVVCANIAGFVKVADAVLDQGVVWLLKSALNRLNKYEKEFHGWS
jgi:hypothetical protein